MWWRGQDLNLRRLSRQIYSLIPLTTREPLHISDENTNRTFRFVKLKKGEKCLKKNKKH